MADRTIKILTPATETDLVTLEEAKRLLGINPADTSQDDNLELMIDVFSETLAELCNRHPTVTFGYEEVLETWRETMNGRVFLSHWPVKEADVLSVTVGDTALSPNQWLRMQDREFHDLTMVGVDRYGPVALDTFGLVAVGDYEVEEASGKISNIGIGGAQSVGWNHPVVIHYKGGYKLPEEAPKPLKHALIMLIREEKIRQTQAQTAGIRQLRHKEAQVSFYDPNALLLRAVGMKSPTMQAVENTLKHYMRFEV